MIVAALVWLVAQEAPTTGSTTTDALIGYGVAAPLVAWLIWQLRTDRRTYGEDIDAHRKQLDLERQANRELYDRIIEAQQQMAPVLAQCLAVLERIARSEK